MTNLRKVCIIAPVHAWDDVRVFQKQAVTLASHGYQVTLLAQAKYLFRQKNVIIKPVISPRSPRFIRFLMLPFVLLQALHEQANLYHLHNPDTLPIAIVLNILGKTVIYDTHEDFKKRILIRDWILPFLRKSLANSVSALEGYVARTVNACIATQNSVIDRLGGRTLLLGNPPRVDSSLMQEVEHLAADIVDSHSGLRAVYIGSVSLSRGLIEMVDALEQANNTSPMRLWLIGSADVKSLAVAKDRPGWCFVDYLPRMPQENAFAYVARSDVGLITLQNLGDYRYTSPNKLYEYMAFGVPFIASDFPVWRSSLGNVDAGWFIPAGDVAALASTLIEASQNVQNRQIKGMNGLSFTRSYNWENDSLKLIDLYSQVLA
jgi:glycosyltransferase involved in cell wall biosynthesis